MSGTISDVCLAVRLHVVQTEHLLGYLPPVHIHTSTEKQNRNKCIIYMRPYHRRRINASVQSKGEENVGQTFVHKIHANAIG